MKRRYILNVITIGLVLTGLITFTAEAHPGRTDSSGGHNCNVGACAGTYHYHNGGGTAPAPAPDPLPVPAPALTSPPAVIPPPPSKPKTIDRLRTLVNENSSAGMVLWADLLLKEVKGALTTTEYKRLNPEEEVRNRILSAPQPNQTSGNKTLYYVSKVTDGDTINVVIDGKTEKLRLLGIDTPETKDPRKPVQCFGRAATEKMTSLVLGAYVSLENDSSQPDRDKYRRLLRYVYLEDGTNVNATMVRDGFAFAYTRFPVSQLDQLRQLEKEARESRLGLWASCR